MGFASVLRIAQNVTFGSATTNEDSVKAMRTSADTADIFHFIHEDDLASVVMVAGAVASFEVLYVIWYLAHILNRLVVFTFATSEFWSFDAVMELSRLTLPQLSTFSALKLMAAVHPVVLYNDFFEHVRDSAWAHTTAGFAAVATRFLLSRIFLATTAVCAFAVKLLAVGFKFIKRGCLWSSRWAAVLALLNNCMGIVLYERILQDRLFLFVFGGQDTEYQNDERALLYVYQCRIAKKIWTTYWRTGQRIKAIVMLVTLDHYDLQRLIINDGGHCDGDDDVFGVSAPCRCSVTEASVAMKASQQPSFPSATRQPCRRLREEQ